MGAEDFPNGTRFQGIIDRCAGTMSVDVPDLLRKKPCIT